MKNFGTLDFFLKICYIDSLKRGTVPTNNYFRLHIYLRTRETLADNSLHVFGN